MPFWLVFLICFAIGFAPAVGILLFLAAVEAYERVQRYRIRKDWERFQRSRRVV